MGMGGGPKHIYTLTSGTYPRGHPLLSLDPYVTAVTAISPPLRISGQLLGASLRGKRKARLEYGTHCLREQCVGKGETTRSANELSRFVASFLIGREDSKNVRLGNF